MPRRKNQNCSELNHYIIQLRRRRTLFTCPRPHCDQWLLSKDFQNHCSQVHRFNPRLGCVWCWGDHSWASGQKHRQVDHLTRCWQDFLARHAPPAPPELAPLSVEPVRPNPVLMDLTPLCPPRNLFGHQTLDVERLYDPLWPVALGPSALTFADDGLTLAAACVRMYIELKDSMDFFHAMVRVVAFPSFLRALDADDGQTRTLPFSTLCDGGRWPEARHRQHRHMIVVSPRGHFDRHVWSKIRIAPEDRPRAHYQCLKKFPILSPSHFINTLGYLSRRESRCDFTQDESTEESADHRNHFWISTALPKQFRLPLFAQYDHGLLDLLGQTYPSFSLDQLLRFPVVYFQHKWRLKIKDLPDLPLGTVLPVSRDLRPCSYPTPAFLCLVNGRQMYFTRDAEPDPWLEQQVQHGNLFYHAVGEELFELRPNHQLLLNQCKPLQLRNEALVAENAKQATDITELRRQIAGHVQRQVRSLKRLVHSLQWKVDRYKRSADRWRRDNEGLRKIILRMTQEDNERLRAEVARLRRELARERRRNRNR